jgi:SAM-dependent methyltransferase
LTQALAEHFQEVHGVDIAPAMIAKAKELNRHGDRCIYYLNEVPHLRLFTDHTLDFVFSALVLQHLPGPLALGYIREFVRVTKPGGLVVFQIPDEHRLPIPSEKQEAGGVEEAFWEGGQPAMTMSGIASPIVCAELEESGARLINAVQANSAGHDWAGSDWLSYLYIAVKLPAATNENQP